MNSIGLDTFLKPAPPAGRNSASSPAPGSTSEFGGYLRDAATSSGETTVKRHSDTVERSERPAIATQQEQGSKNTPEEQTAEVVELGDAIAEDSSEEVEQDEVIFTALAAATADQAAVHDVVQPDTESAAAASSTNEAIPTIVPAAEPAGELATSDVVEETITLPTSSEEVDPVDTGPPTTALPTDTTPVTVDATGAAAPEASLELAEPPTADRKISESQNVTDAPTGLPPASAALDTLENNIEVEPLIDLTNKPGSDTSTPTPTTHGPLDSPPTSADTGSGASGATVARDEPGGQMPMVDRTRFVQRVANAFRSAQQNDGHIQLRLSPPELGSLRIEIAVRNGVLSANLETETAEARRLVLDNLPALRQRLAEQDIRIEKFDVDVRREGGQSDGQAGAQDRQAQQQSQRTAAHNRVRSSQSTEIRPTAVPSPQPASSNSGLDVRI